MEIQLEEGSHGELRSLLEASPSCCSPFKVPVVLSPFRLCGMWAFQISAGLETPCRWVIAAALRTEGVREGMWSGAGELSSVTHAAPLSPTTVSDSWHPNGPRG